MKHLVVVLVVALAIALAAPAAAHDDVGVITFTRAQSNDLSIAVEVTIAYSVDREPAEDATVTAVAEQAGAPTGTPIVLAEAAPGTYAGVLAVDRGGTWTVRVTSLSPSASADTTVEVIAPTTTTTTTPTTTTTTEASPTTSVATDEADSPGPRLWMIAVMVALAAGLGFVLWRGARNARDDPDQS